MESVDSGVPRSRMCPTLSVAEEVTVRDIIDRLSSRWSLWTMQVLFYQPEGEPLRFARLAERVEGISQKMLTQTLRQLERDGLIARTVYPEVPPRVEYQLTGTGREVYAQFRPFWAWTVSRLPDFQEARAEFDGRAGAKSASG